MTVRDRAVPRPTLLPTTRDHLLYHVQARINGSHYGGVKNHRRCRSHSRKTRDGRVLQYWPVRDVRREVTLPSSTEALSLQNISLAITAFFSHLHPLLTIHESTISNLVSCQHGRNTTIRYACIYILLFSWLTHRVLEVRPGPGNQLCPKGLAQPVPESNQSSGITQGEPTRKPTRMNT